MRKEKEKKKRKRRKRERYIISLSLPASPCLCLRLFFIKKRAATYVQSVSSLWCRNQSHGCDLIIRTHNVRTSHTGRAVCKFVFSQNGVFFFMNARSPMFSPFFFSLLAELLVRYAGDWALCFRNNRWRGTVHTGQGGNNIGIV